MKKIRIKRKTSVSLIGWLNIKKACIFSLKYKFNTIIIKIHLVFFEEHDKLILKFMWKNRDLGTGKLIVREKRRDILYIQIKRYALIKHIRLDTYEKLGK